MAIDFNHTIVSARDSKASAEFLAEMLGLPAPRKWGPFQMVTTENGANIDFMNTQHRFHEYRRRDHGSALRIPGQRTGI